MVDIYLYPEAAFRYDVILSFGLRGFAIRHKGWFPPYQEEPVVAGSLFASLVGQYGPVMGLHVFQEMYKERSGPFGEGAKYDPEKRSVARKIAKAGGIIPDPAVALRSFLGKKVRR